jgi:hypothetical protein
VTSEKPLSLGFNGSIEGGERFRPKAVRSEFHSGWQLSDNLAADQTNFVTWGGALHSCCGLPQLGVSLSIFVGWQQNQVRKHLINFRICFMKGLLPRIRLYILGGKLTGGDISEAFRGEADALQLVT